MTTLSVPRLNGEKVRELRRAKGLTQQQLADAVGVSDKVTVLRWEKGLAQPGSAVLPTLAAVLGVDVETLYGESAVTGPDGELPLEPPETREEIAAHPEYAKTVAALLAQGASPPDAAAAAFLTIRLHVARQRR